MSRHAALDEGLGSYKEQYQVTSPISIYVHWPFCLSKCPYCDFNSHVGGAVDHAQWLAAYKKEIEHWSSLIKGRYIKSIFFGGGTPSLMDPKVVKGIISSISDVASVDFATEITLEANPTSVEAKKFEQFKAAGINRVSIGVQSLLADGLKQLGREHSPDEAIEAVKLARNIFQNYSFDLIYARQGQTLESWQEELKEAVEFAGPHISLYQLTIEKATPFYAMHMRGDLVLPENDVAADMYEWTLDYLRKLGYKRYEISNYAKEGFESKHNMVYWNYDEYLGIGPGAHSRVYIDSPKPMALMNYNSPEKWLKLATLGGNAVQTRLALTDKELIEEIVMMGLRLEGGITNEKLQRILDLDFADILDIQELASLIDVGFVRLDNQRLSLTDKGLLMHSAMLASLLN